MYLKVSANRVWHDCHVSSICPEYAMSVQQCRSTQYFLDAVHLRCCLLHLHFAPRKTFLQHFACFIDQRCFVLGRESFVCFVEMTVSLFANLSLTVRVISYFMKPLYFNLNVVNAKF